MVMVVMRQTIPNAQRSHAHIKAALEEGGEAAQGAVLLVPSFARAQSWRKSLSGSSCDFGLTITTFSAWITDRWGLYGDGRVLTSSDQRDLLMYQALCSVSVKAEVPSLEVSPGTVSMLSSMAEEALPSLMKACTAVDLNLSVAEEEVCAVMLEYKELLASRALCEMSEALLVLADTSWPVPPVFFEGFDVFTAIEDHFIEALGSKTEVLVCSDGRTHPAEEEGRSKELVDLQSHIFTPDPDDPVEPTGALCFLMPSGVYSSARLVGDSLVEYAQSDESTFAISAAEPAKLFGELAPYLFDKGMTVTVAARKKYTETDFGRTWVTLLGFFWGDRTSSFQMSDILLSPFSGVSPQKAYELDAAWRGDRTTDKQRCLSDASLASTFLTSVFAALEREAYGEALDLFEKRVIAQGSWDGAYRSEQLASISKTGSFFSLLEGLDVSVLDVLPLLEQSSVPYNAELQVAEADAPHIDIMSFDALAQLDPCSYDCVIMCDLDSAHYPIRDVENAQSRLFEKLGIATEADALDSARQSFFRTLSVPRVRLVCERALNSVDAQELYPSVMLEELLDCYRKDLLSADELDKRTALPKVLLPFTTSRGENMLYEDARVSDTHQREEGQETLPPHGVIDERAKGMIIIPHTTKGIDQGQGLALSPSAIESYLECPYKWFSLRRLRLDELDAGFGALEMGNFAHYVLRRFYCTFQQQGIHKVNAENLKQARSLLSELFDQHLEAQLDMKPGDRPLIPLTEIEKAEVVSFKKKLIRYLEYEAEFLPGFTPRYFEYDFGKNFSLGYADNTLHGSIDRIDVNEKGQAVVIDYKGSVSSEYAFGDSSEVAWAPRCDPEKALVLPHKVQTLLYAQAVRRELGLEVVGALYVSYGHKHTVSGAYDRRVLGPADIPGIDPDTCVACGDGPDDFAAVLDEVENSISCVLSCLAEGFIEPHPRGKDPCGFCPVTACEARR